MALASTAIQSERKCNVRCKSRFVTESYPSPLLVEDTKLVHLLLVIYCHL